MSSLRPLLALLVCFLVLAPAAEAKHHGGKPHAHAKKHRKHHAKKHRLAPAGDRDHDGLTNAFERRARTNPRLADTDHDGILDPQEDGDADNLPNLGEASTHLDPRKPDTDGDGILDGDENAGVVSAVGDGVVTITLARGGTLVAGFDEDTDVICGDAQGDDDPSSDDGDGDFGDDDGDDSADDPTADDDGDDGDDDNALEFDLDRRSVSLDDGSCVPSVGDVVYEADLDTAGLTLVALDLLGA